jgi:hypothetical protein
MPIELLFCNAFQTILCFKKIRIFLNSHYILYTVNIFFVDNIYCIHVGFSDVDHMKTKLETKYTFKKQVQIQ